MYLQEGESGILERLLSIPKKKKTPLERGYRYMRRAFDIDSCYQSTLSRTSDFALRREMPDEIFTSAIILDVLMDTALTSRIKSRIVDFLRASQEDGLFSYFVERGLLPRDVDDTGLALSVLLKASAISPLVAHSAATVVLRNVDAAGVIHVYMPPRGDREGRPRIDPIPCANALYLAYLLGREDEARPTEEFLLRTLQEQGSGPPKEFYYYLSPDMLIYWASRLLKFEGFRAKGHRFIEESWRARVGSSNDALDLALRVLTARNLQMEDVQEKMALQRAQKSDGSWPISPFYKLGRSQVYVGSEPLVTALALRALDGL